MGRSKSVQMNDRVVIFFLVLHRVYVIYYIPYVPLFNLVGSQENAELLSGTVSDFKSDF